MRRQARRLPSLRRVLRTPERWSRIVELARGFKESLPAVADAKALSDFLVRRQAAAPQLFPDLSLAVVKLLGAGEYVLKLPGQPAEGHFGLAVSDYTHATAPNRRFPDVITQRLLKAALASQPAPYAAEELRTLAAESKGQMAGPESSILKIRGTEIQQRITELTLEAVSYYGLPNELSFGANEYIGPDYAAGAAGRYFNMRKTSIYGGSNEIQRNIIAKAVLGL